MTKPVRVLIADDNARSRNGLRALLAAIQLRPAAAAQPGPSQANRPKIEVVGEAINGREAISLVMAHQPDVVLMDARMPKMDGLEATRLIKQRWPTVRVVVMSLYTAYQAKALAAGADAFLIKGCPNEALLKAILDNGI